MVNELITHLVDDLLFQHFEFSEVKFDDLTRFEINQMFMMSTRLFIAGATSIKLETSNNTTLLQKFDCAIHRCSKIVVFFCVSHR